MSIGFAVGTTVLDFEDLITETVSPKAQRIYANHKVLSNTGF